MSAQHSLFRGCGIFVLTVLAAFLHGCAASSPGSSPADSKPFSISVSSLPSAQTGAAYSALIVVTGGAAPYSWSITAGSLPAGLTLNVSNGLISGTPTAAGTSSFTIKVTDSESPAVSKTSSLSIEVGPPSLTITSASPLPSGQQNVAYSQTLAATGGAAPYTWSITVGTLPAGLAINASTGVISGTPAGTGTANFTVQVTDSESPAVSKTKALSITIASATLTITTASLSNGQQGVAYSQTLTATGGATPDTWSITVGTLPAGLAINASTGVISGTPTGTGTANFTVQVTDSESPAVSKTKALSITIASSTLTITTASLSNGQQGTAYSQTLTATGGVTPYSWSITVGTLPAGLSINAATGVISGTPTATGTSSFTVQVTDSASPAQSRTANLSITINGTGSFTVSVSPNRAGLTVTQTLPVTATTNDGAGVNWTASGGSINPTTSTTGVAVNYTAPSSPGVYTLTATSVTDGLISASLTVGVTNLAGVTTYHNNPSRDGANTQEYALTTSNVTTATFGKLFSCAADAAIYAQPLWVSNVNVSGVKHNIVIVATMRNSIYVFDADGTSCTTYWSKQFIPAGETWGVTGDVGGADIQPDIGILGTPVVDPATNTMYFVTKTKTTPGNVYHQRLHAVNITSGSEALSAVEIDNSITVPGNCEGGTTVAFDPLKENQRPGLALVNGVVYVSWASHGDQDTYHGWVIGFNKTTLNRVATLNTSPNAAEGLPYCRGGIWMSGGAPASDAGNNLYLITGNGVYDGMTAFGDSIMRVSTSSGLTVADWFTPHDQAALDTNDADLGSGGTAVLVDQPSGPHPQLLIGGGKAGLYYVLDRTNMGHFNAAGDTQVVQSISVGGGVFASPSFWQNTLYLFASGTSGKAFHFDTTTNTFNNSPSSVTSISMSFPGSTPSIASSGATNGTVWTIDSNKYCTFESKGCGPAVLHAYDAANLGTELWNSAQVAADAAGFAVKFTVPTVANGKVYVGTRGNDTGAGTSSTPGELDVYGLKPN